MCMRSALTAGGTQPRAVCHSDRVVSQRRAAAIAGGVLLVAFVVALVVMTPWHPLPGAVPRGHVAADAGYHFTPAQSSRETAYHSALRPWGYFGLALSLLVPGVLRFTRLGA